MRQIVSFDKLMLTNNLLGDNGHVRPGPQRGGVGPGQGTLGPDCDEARARAGWAFGAPVHLAGGRTAETARRVGQAHVGAGTRHH